MTTLKQPRGWLISSLAIVAILFGLMTIKEGGAVLLGDEAAVAAAGNYVPFVLWFNFLSGFAYIAAGVGLWLQQRWAVWLAVAIAAAIAITFAAFGMHINSGGAYEQRTLIAMSMRTAVWFVIAGVVFRIALRR
ncbi:MAG: hypothetical protein FD121_1444 [Gallionellaceae bacterium]|nr:MAG: hypothetical protein FD121_1444 [Gallionellaceae bacterium]